MFKHLLVPLDGSGLAEAILPYAQVWAMRLGARLTLLHITEKHAPASVHGDRHLGSTEEAREYLKMQAQQWTLPGLNVESHVHADEERGVARMVVDQAAELGADLIVLNTHGSSGLREKLLGSIAQQVVHEGRVPVLLIRPQRDAQGVTAQSKTLVWNDAGQCNRDGVAICRQLSTAIATGGRKSRHTDSAWCSSLSRKRWNKASSCLREASSTGSTLCVIA